MESSRTLQYLIALCVSIVNVSVGSFGSWPATVLPKFHDNQTGFQISKAEISWIVAMSSIGLVLGNLLMRFISNRAGRKRTIMTSIVLLIVTVAIFVWASTAWWLCVARGVLGVSAGIVVSISNVYLVEIADKEIRGSLPLMSRFMISFGMFLTMAIGPFMSYNVLNWTLLSLPLTAFLACLWIPESPYFLLKKGKVDEARKVLIKIRGLKDKTMCEDELSQMISQVENETRRSGSIKELFTGKQYRKSIIISGGMRMFCEFSGLIVMHHYIGLIVKESQFEINLVTMLTMFGAVKFIVGMISSAIVDKVGRRPLLIFSFLGSGITIGLISLYFFLLDVVRLDRDTLMRFSFIPFAGIVISGILANLGYSSLIHMITAELFPLNLRTVAMMLCEILGGIFMFSVLKAYQLMKDVIGLSGVFFVYTVLSLGGAVFSYFLMPETKGKSLKEIQVLLQGDLYEDDDETGKHDIECEVKENLLNQEDEIKATEK